MSLKQKINSLDDANISFQIENKSQLALLIPSILSYNSIYDQAPNLDLGFELFAFHNNRYEVRDSCFMLLQPIIPQEGIIIRKYKTNDIIFYSIGLPVGCFGFNRKFKIRFTFYANYENGSKRKFVSNWYFFEVPKSLM